MQLASLIKLFNHPHAERCAFVIEAPTLINLLTTSLVDDYSITVYRRQHTLHSTASIIINHLQLITSSQQLQHAIFRLTTKFERAATIDNRFHSLSVLCPALPITQAKRSTRQD